MPTTDTSITNVIVNEMTKSQWDNITPNTNEFYIVSDDPITSSDVVNALGYTPYDSSNPSGYTSNVGTVTSVNNVSPVNGNVTLSIPTVNNATLTIQKNGSNVAKFTANSSTNQTANITVPTDNADLTNGAGYITGITSSDVTSALGYTPYNSSNPAGYTSNVGTVTSVNNVSPVSGNVTLSIPVVDQSYDGTSSNAQSGIAVKSAIDSAISSVYKPAGSVAFASLPTLGSSIEGYVYNITDAFTTTSDFVEGAGKSYPAGTNIVCIDVSGTYKWDVLSGIVDLSGYVPTSRTINNKALTSNISLSASDVGALPDNTVIPTVNNATLTIQKNGTSVKTFTANASTDVTCNITVPTDTSDLTNGAGYITGITLSDVTTALGYTPYDSSNPNGYTSNVGTVTSVNNVQPVNGNVTLSIPSVDSALSTTSENPVQNKIITNALNDKQDTISDLDKYLKNSAVSSSGLSILGGSVDKINVIAIGKYSAYDSSKVGANSFNLGGYSLAGEGSVSLGNGTVTKQYSIGILGGTSEPYAIQIGRGTNSTSYTMSVGLGQKDENNNYITYQLLNSSGKIPTDRLAVVTSVSSSSTNAEIPSAKLFYDTCGDIETLINAL